MNPENQRPVSGEGAGAREERPGVFEREARRYDAWFDRPRGAAIFASELLCLRQLTEGLPRPWLEVGVGSGRFADALGVDLGVDPARAPLRYAVRRGVRVLRAEGQALPFEQRSFGAAFAIVTLCFASDPHGLLREAARVTRSDGGVVLGIVPAESPWGRLYAAKGAAGDAFYSHARLYSVAELEELVRASGMSPQRWSCTLFGSPAESGRGIEPPRAGRHALAGFAAVLCRPPGRAKP